MTATNTRVVPSCLHFGRIGFLPFPVTQGLADRGRDLTGDGRQIPDVSLFSWFVKLRRNAIITSGHWRTRNCQNYQHREGWKDEANVCSMTGEKTSPLHSSSEQFRRLPI